MSRFGNLKISTKFYITIVLFFVVLLTANAVDDYHRQESLVVRDAVDNARILAKQIIQAREYMSSVVRDEPETNYGLVPQVVATQVARRITQDSKFYVRQVSLRYRNPNNRPDNYEAGKLKEFRGKPAQETYQIATINGERVFRYMLSMTAEKTCLHCHGSYDEAPAFVRARFPRGHYSYNYTLGEVIGAVSVSIPMVDLYRQIGTNLKKDILYSSGVLLLLIVTMGLFIRRIIIRPIETVSATVANITRSGNFSERIPERSKDEIGQLVRTLNNMMEELGHRIEQRMESEDRYRKFIEMARSAVVTFLDDGKIVISNQNAEELFGLSRQDLLGENIYAYLEGGKEIQRGVEAYLRNGDGEVVGTTTLCRVRNIKGQVVELEMALSASKGEARTMFTAIFREPLGKPAEG
jgi:PAS domain S-box-containing protein